MATELGTAYISIVAETSGIPRQVRSALGMASADAERQGRQVGTRFSSGFGSSMKKVAGLVGVTAGVAGVVGAMKSAISSGMDFTNALNTMKAVSGATEQQLSAVSAEARKLGTDNKLAATSSVDAANAMLELSKGGFSVEQSMQAARGTLQLAAAAQIDAAQAATIQSQALQAFGKDATYAGQTADILANAANASSAEITDVAGALAQSGTVANQFGVTMNDTAAAIAMMANAGIQGSDAGTLLKSALLALTDQGNPAQGAIKELGLTVYDTQGKFVGLSSLFGQLNTASKSMTSEQYQAATAVLFGSDAMRIAGIAAQQGKEGFDKMSVAMGRQGAAADVAQAKMAGLPGAWEKLKNSAQDAGLAFYDVAKGPLTSMALVASDSLESIVSKVSEVGGRIGETFNGPGVKSGLQSLMTDSKDAFTGLGYAVSEIAPAVGRIASQLAIASAALGISGWKVFLAIVQAIGATLQTVEPILSGIASLMENNTGVVIGLAGAFLLFKTIPGLIARVSGPMQTLTTRTQATMAAFRGTSLPIAQLQRLAGVTRDANGVFRNSAGTAITAARYQRMMGDAAQQAGGRMSTMAGQARAGATALGTIAAANGRVIQTTSMGAVQMGRFGSAIGQMGTHVPVIGRMQTAYMNAATQASHFGRTQGVIRGAMVGAKGAVSGLAGALGGPLSAALIAAGIAYTVIASKNGKATQAAESYTRATKELAGSQNELYVALLKTRGAVTDDVFSAQEKTVGNLQDQLDATTKSTGSFLDMFRGAGSDGSMWDSYVGGFAEAADFMSGGMFDHTSQNDRLNQMGKEAAELQKGLVNLGYTNETLTKAVYGSDGAFGQLVGTLKNADGTFKSEAAGKLASDWSAARKEFQNQQDAAKRVVPGISELGKAFEVMGNSSSSASDKLSALKAAMDALNPARSKTEAMSQYGDTIRKAADAAAGIDATAFKGDQLDSFTTAGKALGETLKDLADKTTAVVANGDMKEMGKTAQENQKIFETLAQATGKSVEEIKSLYMSLGGTTPDIMIKLHGDTDVTQKLGTIQLAFDRMPKGVPIEIPIESIAGAEKSLESIGITIKKMPNGKTVQLTLTGDAKAKLDNIVAAMEKLPAGKAVSVTSPGGQEVKTLLESLGVQVNKDNKKDVEVTSPLAQGVLDLLKSIGLEVRDGPNGKKIIVTAADADYQSKKVEWTKDVYKKIIAQGVNFGDAAPTGGTFRGPGLALNANGSVRQYLNGGISALESYANGGARLPNSAIIQKPDRNGGLVQWAEPSTKGEAFIPLADSKRSRSTSILQTVASMFGYDLVDKTSPDGVSGWLGALSGSAVKGLTKRAGVDGVTAFADGGLRSPAEFLQLAQGGFGASRPLQGAPYVLGGVNWGDCSGAMSAFARFAAGLEVWGGRFATASQAAALQAMGATSGRGPSGTMRFGWYNGGPGGGHTAGTLPDGTNVEMGGGNGGGAIGAGVGADSPQFTDHAYFPAAAATGSPTDGNSGDYSGGDYGGDRSLDPEDNGTSTNTASKDNSLSGRLGDVAKSFVSGQISSFFDVLSINDQPGWLAAITEYENKQKSADDGEGNSKLSASQKLAIKQKYDSDKLTRKQAYDSEVNALEEKHRLKQISDADYESQKLAAKESWENADLKAKQDYDAKVGGGSYSSLSLKQDYSRKKLAREQQYDREKLALDNQLKSKSISQEAHDSQVAVLKNKLDADNLTAQQEYDRAKLNGSQTYNRLKQQKKDNQKPKGGKKTRDPGTQKPGKGEDLPLPKLFDRGGSFGPGLNLVENKLGKTETGLPFSPEELKRSLEGGGSGNAQILSALHSIAELLKASPRGQVNYNLPADRSVERVQKISDSRRRAGLPA